AAGAAGGERGDREDPRLSRRSGGAARLLARAGGLHGAGGRRAARLPADARVRARAEHGGAGRPRRARTLLRAAPAGDGGPALRLGRGGGAPDEPPSRLGPAAVALVGRRPPAGD